MQTMVENAGYGHNETTSRMTYQDYKVIGDLSLNQLNQLRHRGAFSTVARTFASCCIQCARSEDPKVASLPMFWYQVWA